ncbi:MAG: hypothetical protein ABJZ55_20520 [Fuerstiella sp.]
MSDKKSATSVYLTPTDETEFESAMAAEGMDKLGPWLKRAARLHADRVLHGKNDDLAELRAEVRQLKTMITDLTITIRRPN